MGFKFCWDNLDRKIIYPVMKSNGLTLKARSIQHTAVTISITEKCITRDYEQGFTSKVTYELVTMMAATWHGQKTHKEFA